ncbi:MAG: glycerate kinase [Cyanobacteria bacterium P01_F01_bin.150]
MINALAQCLNGLPYDETRLDVQALQRSLANNKQGCLAFGLSEDMLQTSIQRRWTLLQAIYPQLNGLCCDTFGWKKVPLETAWQLWLPLALNLTDAHATLQRPIIQGILGGQGTGKTSLGAILSLILTYLGQTVCSISIDDIYKTYADRQILKKSDPRLIWRGPPGTHDVELGLKVLRGIKSIDDQAFIKVPRFDKAAWQGEGDRTQPEILQRPSIVLFEGWFVGTRPIAPETFDHAPAPITTEADRAFARDTNERLWEYLPLWDELDRLMVLYPTNYRMSQQWRREAEQKMRASGQDGMSDDQINQFVTYFWQSLHPELFITPLLTNSKYVDLVVEIDSNHSPCAIYSPSS